MVWGCLRDIEDTLFVLNNSLELFPADAAKSIRDMQRKMALPTRPRVKSLAGTSIATASREFPATPRRTSLRREGCAGRAPGAKGLPTLGSW